MQVVVSGITVRVAFAVAALSLAACNVPPVGKVRVGNVDFCVPDDNRREINIWWIPEELPKGGFLFTLRATLDGTVGGEISGLVEDAHRYPRWREKPALDTQIWKELSSREGRRLVVDGRYIAAGSQSNYSYLVWNSGKEPVLIDDEYTDKSEVIASCLVPKPNDKRITCNRIIHLDSVAVDYTFDVTFLDKIELLDKRVSSAINAWRC